MLFRVLEERNSKKLLTSTRNGSKKHYCVDKDDIIFENKK